MPETCINIDKITCNTCTLLTNLQEIFSSILVLIHLTFKHIVIGFWSFVPTKYWFIFQCKSYRERSEMCQHSLLKRLYSIMETKSTNLAVSVDLTKSEDILQVLNVYTQLKIMCLQESLWFNSFRIVVFSMVFYAQSRIFHLYWSSQFRNGVGNQSAQKNFPTVGKQIDKLSRSGIWIWVVICKFVL